MWRSVGAVLVGRCGMLLKCWCSVSGVLVVSSDMLLGCQ